MSKENNFEAMGGGTSPAKKNIQPLSETISNERVYKSSKTPFAPKATNKRSALFRSIFGEELSDQLEKTSGISQEAGMQPENDMYDNVEALGEVLPEGTIAELREKYLVREGNNKSSTEADDEFVTPEGSDLPEGVIEQLSKNYKVETENMEEPEAVHRVDLRDEAGQVSQEKEEVSEEELIAQLREDAQIAQNAKDETLPEELIDQAREEAKKAEEEPEEVLIADLHDEVRRVRKEKEEVPEEEYIAQLREDAQIAQNAKKVSLAEELIDQAREEAKKPKTPEEGVEKKSTGTEPTVPSEPEEEVTFQLADEPKESEPEEEVEFNLADEPKESEPADIDHSEESKQKTATESVQAENDENPVSNEAGESKEGEKPEENPAQEKTEKSEAWKESKEQYIAYRREVRKAKKTFFEKTEVYEREKKDAGVLARLLATPALEKAKNEMLDAQKEYDEKLVEWRDRRGEIIGSFVEKQRAQEGSESPEQKARKEKKNEERGPDYVNYIARREAILEHQIDNEVSTLESLRYNENDKGESRNIALRFAKAGWNGYLKIPKAGRIAIGIGLGVAFTGLGVAGVAARKLAYIYAGGYAAQKTKQIGDEWAEARGEEALQKQHEAFAGEELGKSREARMKIRRNVRTRKNVATAAAFGAAWAVGGSAADLVDPLSVGDGTLVSTAHAGTLPEKYLGDFEKQAPSTPEAGRIAPIGTTEGVTLDTRAEPIPFADRATLDTAPQTSPLANGVTLETELRDPHMPESGDIAVFPKTETVLPRDPHMPESGDIAVFPNTHMPESGDIAVFPTTHLPESGGIVQEIPLDDGNPENLPPSTVPQDGSERMTPREIPLDDGNPENLPQSTVPQDGPERMTPREIPLDDGNPENAPLSVPREGVPGYSADAPSHEISDLMKKLGIDTEKMPVKDSIEGGNTIYPQSEGDINTAPDEPTPEIAQIYPEKEVTLKGVYEAGSSVEGELQDFLKNDTWVKETYPELTDDERGAIAHVIQQEIAKDPDMMKNFGVRGENWNSVARGGTYEATLSRDLFAKHIEAIHSSEDVPTVATPLTEKPSSSLPLDNDAENSIEESGKVHPQGEPEEGVRAQEEPTPKSEAPAVTEPVTEGAQGSAEESAPAPAVEEDMPKVERDLRQAEAVLEKQGADYHGEATLPSIKDFFKEGYFKGSLIEGQKHFILSYWGPMSHARLQDIFDSQGSLSYTIGDNPPVTMGTEVESLTRNIALQLERSLEGKLPGVSEIIEQGHKNNLTLGELVNELHLRIESAESLPPQVVDESVYTEPAIEAPLESAGEVVPEKPLIPVEKIPLAEYKLPTFESVANSTEGPMFMTKLVPIEISKDIENLVEIKYPVSNPEWSALSAREFFENPQHQSFRAMVLNQLVDIAADLKGNSDIPLSKISIDWSAFEHMTPTEMMMQLEQHEHMIEKLNQSIPEGAVIHK